MSPVRLVALAVLVVAAQLSRLQAQVPTLTLDEAHRLARLNNPEFQQTLSAERSATASVRTAYGAFLPTVNGFFGTSYQQGGRQVFNGAELGASSDVIQSSYSIGLALRLNAATFLNPRVQKANRSAVETDIDGSMQTLRGTVTQQYLTVLQSLARSQLQDSLIASATLQLQLAQARAAAGAGIALDVQRAEVALGQIQVAQIQARNQVEIDKLRLFQSLGVSLPMETQLITEFALVPPTFQLDSVLAVAREFNPTLRSFRAREDVARIGVSVRKAEYLPSFTLSTGFGGYTYQYQDADFLVQRAQATTASSRASCLTNDSLRVGAGLPSIRTQCESIVFTPDAESGIRQQNRQFPFDFTRNPRSLNASLSVSIFDGFGREQRVQEAQIARQNAQHALRSRETSVNTEVSIAYLSMLANVRSAQLQELNAAKARQELELALERYRVGSANFIEVADSRSQFERAEMDRINSIYDFHKSFAALESAVGRPLR